MLQAHEVGLHVGLRFASKHLCDHCAGCACRWIVLKLDHDLGSAAGRVREPYGSSAIDRRTFDRSPTDEFVTHFMNHFRIPFHALAGGSLRDPVRAFGIENRNRFDVLHELREVGEVAPEREDFRPGAFNPDHGASALAELIRNAGGSGALSGGSSSHPECLVQEASSAHASPQHFRSGKQHESSSPGAPANAYCRQKATADDGCYPLGAMYIDGPHRIIAYKHSSTLLLCLL